MIQNRRNAIRKHMNVLKPNLQIAVAESYASTEIKQRCAIRVADSGIPASRANICNRYWKN
nr:MAG TPA: hypothetical protein [Caudoviricetes sp.]